MQREEKESEISETENPGSFPAAAGGPRASVSPKKGPVPHFHLQEATRTPGEFGIPSRTAGAWGQREEQLRCSGYDIPSSSAKRAPQAAH